MDKTKEIFKSALLSATKSGAQSAKIGFSSSNSLSVGFEAGRLKETASAEKVGYTISVLVDGKLAEVSGNRMDQVEKMVDQAIALAKVGKPSHFDKWPEQTLFQTVASYSPDTESLTRQDFIENCEKIVAKIKAYNDELYICSNGANGITESTLLNSEGFDYTNKTSSWSLSGMAQRTQGQDILFAGEGRSWRKVNDYFDTEEIADKIIEDLKNAESNVDAPTGDVKAFLSPNIFYNLLYPIFMGTNGLNIFKGDSPLKDKLEQQIIDPSITIIDNPHISFCNSACEIDYDGIPSQKQTIIDKGVLKTFLYDLDTAGMAKVPPTGNKDCNPHNIIVNAGQQTNEEIISSMSDGIYMKSFIGYGQGNLINGDFSCNLGLGYRIQDGKITGRVKDVMVSGNIYNILKQNVLLSKETNYPGFIPYAVVEGISISSKQ